MAKLLIITQKVDATDPILGFFHLWIEKFAKKFDKISVLCLERGQFNLPKNVNVISLGKYHGIGKIVQASNFYSFILFKRQDYDKVFVHMNPIGVVAGGLFWRLMSKKILFWYTHPAISFKLKMAVKFADKILTASENSFPIRSSKVIVTGHGIDTELFRRNHQIAREPNSILYAGRLARVKNLNILDEAVRILKEEGSPVSLNIIGGDKKVPNKEMPNIYNRNQILINLTDAGSFDKTVLEAMACESLVLVSNRSLANIVSEKFIFNPQNPKELAHKIRDILGLTEKEKENFGIKFRDYVVKNHNLDDLISKISQLYEI